MTGYSPVADKVQVQFAIYIYRNNNRNGSRKGADAPYSQLGVSLPLWQNKLRQVQRRQIPKSNREAHC